ncbi:HNH endonuclease [Paucibacter soli]|uniref:HNH endonuclease n=1 Tax=Paucibacter soli TaxID=3133433 RepID=UPI0030B3F6B7
MTSILELDAAGTPNRWISPKQAAQHIFSGSVAWSVGEPRVTLRGGINAATGRQSLLAVPPIIAVDGVPFSSKSFHTPAVTREALFERDRCQCAYCGQVFNSEDLTADHILPVSRGGPWSWMNLVSACGGSGGCNGRKGNRRPEEAGMPLLYLPYVPSRHEHLILSGRRICADQHAWLMSGVPAHSRLWS